MKTKGASKIEEKAKLELMEYYESDSNPSQVSSEIQVKYSVDVEDVQPTK